MLLPSKPAMALLALWIIVTSFASVLCAEIGPYLEIQRHKEAVEKLDQEDSGILDGIVAVEKQHMEQVVLYHALPFYLYILMWIWNGVVDEKALKWQTEDLKTPYPVAKSPLSMRVFEGKNRFPSFSAPDPRVCKDSVTGFAEVRDQRDRVGKIMSTGTTQVGVNFQNGESEDFSLQPDGCFELIYTGLEAQGKYVEALSEAELTKQHVDNSRSFSEYLERIGVWNDTKNTPDHIAGVRQRIISVNLNVFGYWRTGWTDSSWDIFRKGLTLHAFGLGGRVPFLEDIFSNLQASTDTQKTVEKQLDFMTCIIGNRESTADCDSKFDESLWSCESEDQLVQLKKSSPKAEKCHKIITGTSDNDQCGTDVLLQLILSRDLANELVYVSVEGGKPGWENASEAFSESYDKLKNHEAGDSKQGRVLLRSDAFHNGRLVTFAGHSSLFKDELMTSLSSLGEDVRRTLLGRFEACERPDTTAPGTTMAPEKDPSTTAAEDESKKKKTPVKFDVGVFRVVAILLLAVGAILFAYHRWQRRPRQPQEDRRVIEMPERA